MGLFVFFYATIHLLTYVAIDYRFDWMPIFDDQKVYSMGCVTIDSNNPHNVWLGTGENVGGRHVAYGDGIYKSNDDGGTWFNASICRSR